ncbi:hypothetical protein BZZ08_07325 [Streptomyces sp. MH60]|nr:hypothetical protein BZZ08_07325 [Streptomyces sp. MH60]
MLPVLRAAGHHEPCLRLPQPRGRALGPLGETVRQDGRHLLGAVEEDQEGPSGGAGQVGETLRGDVAEVAGAGSVRGGDDAGGPGQRPASRVRQRHVVVAQVGPAQPERGRRVRARGTTGGEGRQLGRPAAARRADQAEHAGAAGGEGGELSHHRRPFDRFPRAGSAARPGSGVPVRDRRRREGEHPGQVEVGAVRRDRRRVLGEELGERARGRAAQRHGEADVAVSGAEGGAEDAEDGTGRHVEHGAAGRAAAQPQGVPSTGADGQFEGVAEEVEAVGGRVGDVGGAQDPGLAPAAGGDPHVRPGLDAVPRGERQGGDAEPLGAHQGQAEGGQRGHVGGGHHAPAAPGGAQDQPGQAVDRFVAGEHRAVVVGDESRAAGTAGEVVEADQGGVGRAPRRIGLPQSRGSASCFQGAVTGPLPRPAARRPPGPVPRRHRRTSPPYTRAVCSTVGAR